MKRTSILFFRFAFAYITQSFLELSHLYEREPESFPEYRRPTSTQVRDLVSNVKKRERLESDPLLAIEVFAERNPDLVFK